MIDKHKIQQQIDTLQEKILFQEDSLQKLEVVVSKQYDLIEALQLKLIHLQDKCSSLQDELENGAIGGASESEKPPHY